MTSRTYTTYHTSLLVFGLLFGTLLSFGFMHTSSWAQDDHILCFGGNATIPSALVVREGNTLTYTVNLCHQPPTAVDVSVTTSIDASWDEELSVDYSPNPIIFDSVNWNIPAAISVKVKIDDKVEAYSERLHIQHIADSQDENFKHILFGEYVVINILESHSINYLPLVHRPNVPTPAPTPIPIPTAQWGQFRNLNGDIDTVIVHEQAILIGSRDADDSKKGIYRGETCAIDAVFQQPLSGKRVQGIAFSGNHGIAAVNGDRIYYSQDSGVTWQRTTSNMNQFVLATAYSDNGKAYAGTDDGVYVSTDQGISWAKVNAGNNPILINDFTYHSPSNLLWIGALGSGVWKLSSSTDTFVQRADGLPDANSDRFVWDTTIHSNDQIFVATTNGVYTGDGETAWTPFGLQSVQVLGLAVVGDTLYAGTLGQGLKQRNLSGGDWTSAVGLPDNITVREIFYDETAFCTDAVSNRHALLAATTNGLWIYR